MSQIVAVEQREKEILISPSVLLVVNIEIYFSLSNSNIGKFLRDRRRSSFLFIDNPFSLVKNGSQRFSIVTSNFYLENPILSRTN